MDALVNDFFQDMICRDHRPVFLQEWWLATVREAINRPYHEARVVRDGMVAGYLGYTLKKNRIGLRSWEPFDWCRVNEPILNPDLCMTGKAEVLRELFGQLPKAVSFEFVCGPTAPDLPLIAEIAAEAGFKQRRETVFLQAPELSLNILHRLNKKYRQSIRRAAADLEFVDLSPEGFIRLYNANLIAARRRPYSDPNVAKRLLEAAINRREPQARIWAVKKKAAPAGSAFIDAAVACVWDDKTYYYWMTTCSRFGAGEGHEKAHTHAVKYLLVHAIQDAGERGLIFDSDGDDSPEAARQFKDLKFENKAQRIVFMRHTMSLRLYNWLKKHQAEFCRKPAANPSTSRLYSTIRSALPFPRRRSQSSLPDATEAQR